MIRRARTYGSDGATLLQRRATVTAKAAGEKHAFQLSSGIASNAPTFPKR